MKTHLHVSAFSFQLSAFLLLLLLLLAAPVHAQTWSNNGTDWGTTTNWTGGVVPNSTSANVTFNGTITSPNQPAIGTGNYTITRLNVGSASSNVTLSGGAGSLTITSATSSSLFDVAANRSLTISANTTLASAYVGGQWAPKITTGVGSVLEFASGSTLTSNIVSGNATSIAYQVTANGIINFNGAVASGGVASTIAHVGNGTINWNPSSTTGTFTIQQAGFDGSQFNLYKSTVGNIAYGTSGNGTRTVTIKANALTFGALTTMGPATTAGSNAYKNVLAIDDGTASAISVSLTNLSLTSNSTNGTNELFVGANDTMTFTGNITRTGGTTATTLTKTGTGTLVFSGNNTTSYTDATVVSAGTLLLSGNRSMSGNGSVTVAAGATLGGIGTIGGATTINGTHSPGNSPGLQTFSSNLTYNSATVAWELAGNSTSGRGSTFDGINVGGNLTFTGSTGLALTFNGGNSTVDWSSSLWNADITGTNGWLIYDVTGAGALTGNLTVTVANWADAQGDLFNTVRAGSSFSTYQSGNDLYLNYAVPEPTTWALLAASLTTVMVLRRRRRS
jgi:autotransporter-associated beta strand protein